MIPFNFKDNWDASDIQDVTNKSANHSTINNSTSNLVPQHHYQTRYLTHCLEQKQEAKADSSIDNSSSNSSVKNVIRATSTTSIPTTRLRYQQQLAAQAAISAKFACDLDLDQIEND